MIYVLALLWICSLVALVLVPWLIHELTTPANADLAVLERHRDARTALRRATTRHTSSTSASAWTYGADAGLRAGTAPHGAEVGPFEQRDAHAAPIRSLASGDDVAHAIATKPTRSSPERRVGLLDLRHI